jgi:hypothetical protein
MSSESEIQKQMLVRIQPQVEAYGTLRFSITVIVTLEYISIIFFCQCSTMSCDMCNNS